MNVRGLSFDVVDDLSGAFQRRRLRTRGAEPALLADHVGPLVELHLQLDDEGRKIAESWLAPGSSASFRSALRSQSELWIADNRASGLLRSTLSPGRGDDDPKRTLFLVAASSAAQGCGFPKAVALRLVAAMREMETNIHEHSGRPDSGLIAYRACSEAFEFVVADAGVGILATISEAPEFRQLSDHGRAMLFALRDRHSRYGSSSLRGMGFHDLFVGLASLNADLRFRSGDHALLISGNSPDLKSSQLAQKPYFQGFLAAVRCSPPRAVVHH